MMLRAKWIVLALLALPAAEILVFIAVVLKIGFLAAFALTFATSLAGVSLLRAAGGAQIAHFGGTTIRASLDGGAGSGTLFRIFAGVLLTLPGFLTDIAGAMLLFPVTRQWLFAAVAATLHRLRTPASTNQVLDLDPAEWKRLREDDDFGDRPDAPRR